MPLPLLELMYRGVVVLFSLYIASKFVYEYPPEILSLSGWTYKVSVEPPAESTTLLSFEESIEAILSTADNDANRVKTLYVEIPSFTDNGVTDFVDAPLLADHEASVPPAAIHQDIHPGTVHHDIILTPDQIEATLTTTEANLPMTLLDQESRTTLTGDRLLVSTWNSRYMEKEIDSDARELAIYIEPPWHSFVARWLEQLYEGIENKLWGFIRFQHGNFPVGILLFGMFIGWMVGRVTIPSRNVPLAEHEAKLKAEKTKATAEYISKFNTERAELAAQYEVELENEKARLAAEYTAKLDSEKGELAAAYKAARDNDITEMADAYIVTLGKEMAGLKAEHKTNLENQRRSIEESSDAAQINLLRLGEDRLQKEQAKRADEYKSRLEAAETQLRDDYEAKLENGRKVAKEAAELAAQELAKVKAELEDESESTQVKHQDGDAAKLQDIVDQQSTDLDQRDAAIESRNDTIASLKATIEQQCKDLDERDTTISNRNGTITDQNTVIDKQIKYLQERDATITDKIDGLAELSELVIEQKSVIEDCVKTINDEEAKLKGSERTVLQRDMAIEELNRDKSQLKEEVKQIESEFREHLKVCRGSQAATANTEAEQKPPSSQSEVTARNSEAEGNVQTAGSNVTGTTKVNQGIAGATSAAGESNSARGDADDSDVTTPADDAFFNENDELESTTQDTETARSDTGPNAPFPTVTLVADQPEFEVQNTSQTVGSDTIDLTETGDTMGAASSNSIGSQQTTADEITAVTRTQSNEQVASNDENTTPAPPLTTTLPRSQSRNRGYRSACTQCKSANLNCDTHKTPCDNCFNTNIECSREQADQPQSPLVVNLPAKSANVSKLAVKLKEDLEFEISREETQRRLDAKECPICAERYHKAKECPQHPVLGRENAARADDTQTTAASATAAPEPVTQQPLTINTGSTTTFPRNLSPPSSPRRAPLVVGGTDNSPTKPRTQDQPEERFDSLYQSRWAPGSSRATPTTPSTYTTPSSRGQNPTAQSFTPTRPLPTHNPITGFEIPLPGRRPNNPHPGSGTPTSTTTLITARSYPTINPVTGFPIPGTGIGTPISFHPGSIAHISAISPERPAAATGHPHRTSHTFTYNPPPPPPSQQPSTPRPTIQYGPINFTPGARYPGRGRGNSMGSSPHPSHRAADWRNFGQSHGSGNQQSARGTGNQGSSPVNPSPGSTAPPSQGPDGSSKPSAARDPPS